MTSGTRSDPADKSSLDDPVPTSALFQRRGSRFHPTEATLGPWGEEILHGGPVSGLLAHCLLTEAGAGRQLVRLTVDMPRPVRREPLEVVTGVLRRGRRVLLAEASVISGEEVARATGLFLTPSVEPDPTLAQHDSTISSLETSTPAHLPRPPVHHANCIGLRRGLAGAYWVSIANQVIEGEGSTPVERAAIAADWTNPAANFGSDGIGYINPDLTLYLHREPTGQWFGIGPAIRHSTNGIAIADCPLTDDHGVFGRCLTAGLAAGRITRAPGLRTQD